MAIPAAICGYGVGVAPRLARLARLPVPKSGSVLPESAADTPAEESDRADYRHGRAFTGEAKTWTGRIVSLNEWRGLSDWDRHGSTGKLWNGTSQKWE